VYQCDFLLKSETNLCAKKYFFKSFIDHKEFLLNDIALMHTALARNRLLQDLGNGAMHAVDDTLYR